MQFEITEAYDEACRIAGDLLVKNNLMAKFIDGLMVPSPEAMMEEAQAKAAQAPETSN